MTKDFLIDPHYDLYASDFLSVDEIEESTAPRVLSPEDEAFWAAFYKEVYGV